MRPRAVPVKLLALLAVLTLIVGLTGVSGATGAASAEPPGPPRSVTFVNETAHTIWLAGWQQTPTPALRRTGWVLPAGHSTTISVPNHWNGRFWGRTGCVFHDGRGHCRTGDCGGLFQCRGYGAIPATLAEYNLDAWDDLDFYDVSMVDGSNLPMYINIAKGATPDKITKWGCVHTGCTNQVRCPTALRVTGGCESPCAKLGGDRYCCAGKYAADCSPERTWPIDYAKVFKRAEPYAYSWSGDDRTSVYTCSGPCDYRITFGLTPPNHRYRPPATARRS